MRRLNAARLLVPILVAAVLPACGGGDESDRDVSAESSQSSYPPVRYLWDVAAPVSGVEKSVAEFAVETLTIEKRLKYDPGLTELYRYRVDGARFDKVEAALDVWKKNRPNDRETGGAIFRVIKVERVEEKLEGINDRWDVTICAYDTPGIYTYTDSEDNSLLQDLTRPSTYKPHVFLAESFSGVDNPVGVLRMYLYPLGESYARNGVDASSRTDVDSRECDNFRPVPQVSQPPNALPRK